MDQNNFFENEYSEIFVFCKEIFIGIENKVFSSLVQDSKTSLEILKTKDAKLLGINLIEIYLNQVYKHLIEKDDNVINEKFSILTSKVNSLNKEREEIEAVYLLNICANVINKCYPLLPRSKLNIESEEVYFKSLLEVIDTMEKYMILRFKEDLEKFYEEQKNK
jgi:hypothetical protein